MLSTGKTLLRNDWYCSLFRLLFCCLLLGGFLSCGGGGGGEEGGGVTLLEIFTFATMSDGNGKGSIVLPLPPQTTKFAVNVETDAGFVRIEKVQSSNGTLHLASGNEFLTFGTEFVNGINTANIPSRDFDAQVVGGTEQTIEAFAGNLTGSVVKGTGNQVLLFTLHTKADLNLNGGRLPVNVFRVGEISQTVSGRAASEEAVNRAQGIFSREANITLDVSSFDIAGPSILPNPSIGSEFYLTASRSIPGLAINVFIGGDIDIEFAGGALGLASSIPGPSIPSRKSAVVISLLNGAGIDGKYSEDEIQILAETIAHEMSHYLGLFHPVEVSATSDNVFDEDPLPDTGSCQTLALCDERVFRNLMFPFPILLEDGSTLRQNILTEQQRGVLNQYIVVD